MLKPAKTTSPQERFDYDCITLYIVQVNISGDERNDTFFILFQIGGQHTKNSKIAIFLENYTNIF